MIILNRLQGGFAGVEALVATIDGDCRRPGGHLEMHVAQVWNDETCQDDLTKICFVIISQPNQVFIHDTRQDRKCKHVSQDYQLKKFAQVFIQDTRQDRC